MEETAVTELQEAIDENKEKLEAERRQAEDVRVKVMETMGKLKKGGGSKAKKSRRSGSGAIEYLKERAVEDLPLKSQGRCIEKARKRAVSSLPNSTNTDFKAMLEKQHEQQKQ